jgi:hypothetical protein
MFLINLLQSILTCSFSEYKELIEDSRKRLHSDKRRWIKISVFIFFYYVFDR